MSEKVKAWITWPDNAGYGWYSCQLVLENGWPIYGHLCSSPYFAEGDLWKNRKERHEEWVAKGLELEIVAQVPHSELPKDVLEANRAGAYIEWAKKHFPEYSKEEEHPSVTAEVAP